jgi:putative N6-adenine-specific DNA methylase/tRNA (guanine6-N2)-methyltransferase
VRFLLTTDPGIEDLVADELRERCPGATVDTSPYGFPGQVRAETLGAAELLRLGTIHHVVEIRGEFDAESLDDVRHHVADVPFPELATARSFRASSTRLGEHGFGSTDLARAGGGVLNDRYGTTVDLEHHEVNARVDLYGNRLVVGLQLTRDSLGKRIERAKALRTSLKPTVAVAMLRLAGAQNGAGRLIDPMCGTGTIPIEARRINPQLELFASDWDEQTVTVARDTFRNHDATIDLRVCDARSLPRLHPGPFDFIVTDPPYGVRQAKRMDLTAMYGSILPSMAGVLADTGRIVLLVVKRRAFLRALDGGPLRIVHERLIDIGGLHPRIYVLRRDGSGTGV